MAWLVSGTRWLQNYLENHAVVVGWVGFKETRYLDGLCYDSYNQYYAMVSQWNKLDYNIPVSQ